jgi:hypothetical protein
MNFNICAVNQCIAYIWHTGAYAVQYADDMQICILKNSYNIWNDHLFLKNFNIKIRKYNKILI